VNPTNPAQAAPVGPSAPNLTVKNLGKQFWADAYGKEVQTAATYSYTWLADQFGHICIGILANFLATLVAGWAIYGFRAFTSGASPSQIAGAALEAPYQDWEAAVWGLVIAVIGSSLWELSAYRSSVKNATGTFPLDTTLLRDNAIIATVYMALGAVLGFAFHRRAIPALLISFGVVVAAILLAPRWLRQKITWQKAALPYLFRLADAAPTIAKSDADELQSLIKAGTPPAKLPCQVVIGGPIRSGRTPLAAGIGTEFAFKNNKVRYLSLDMLLEFAVSASGHPYPDDPGPTTIMYWPWSQAQVVIIDDVGPLIAAQEPEQQANLRRFTALLQNELKSIAGLLAQCHTVWVIGDLRPPYESGTLTATLNDFARAITGYCSSQRDALVIELREAARPLALKGAPQTAVVQSVRWVGPKKNP
jgi:hypothetical protein